MKNIERILFVTLSNVGDAVLTLPALDALHRAFPVARVDVLASPAVCDIFEGDSRVSKVFIYAKKDRLFEKYRLVKKLFCLRYGLVVDLKNTLLPFIVLPGYMTNPVRAEARGVHKKDEHLKRLSDIGIDTTNASMNMEVTDRDKETAAGALATLKKPYVVINPGAKSHTKRWAPEKFADLAGRIIRELGCGVVVIGTDQGRSNPDSDRVVADKMLKSASVGVLDIVGKTRIKELACVIAGARAIVTNDSAPLHVAGSVGTPAVAIFGPTDEKKYGPLSPRSVVIRKNPGCAPCGKPQCDRSLECLGQITVDEVFRAVKDICAY